MHTQIDLNKSADQCVMCGMCLPHCPTYQVSQHEAESPRGRISLVKAFVENQLAASETLESHLQSCTNCLKCQQICPAKVNYQEIIDFGKTIYRNKQSVISRLVDNITIETSTHSLGHTAIKLASHVAKRLPTKSRHTNVLNYVSAEPSYRSNTQHSTSVNVFPGCTGNLFDQQTLSSLLSLLNAIEVNAELPKQVICCGALAQHSGLPEKAQKNISQLEKYLSAQQSETLLSFASGCGRQLNEHLTHTQAKHFDALHWLSQHEKFNNLTFSETTTRVLIHHPCTLSQSTQQRTIELLRKIPNIELIHFDDNLACCGAGGMQLTSPEKSNQDILDRKINTIRTLQPDLIISSNIGCSLNYKLGLDSADLDIEVIHPLTLLARQLDK